MRGDAGHLDGSPASALAHHVAVEAVENALVRQLQRVVEQNQRLRLRDFHRVGLRKALEKGRGGSGGETVEKWVEMGKRGKKRGKKWVKRISERMDG